MPDMDKCGTWERQSTYTGWSTPKQIVWMCSLWAVLCYHECDNPGCYEIQHLTLGTHADNVEDKIRKGRGGRKLTWADVEAMRKAYRPKCKGNKYGNGRELREQYGINQPTFSAIIRGDLWKPELAPEV